MEKSGSKANTKDVKRSYSTSCQLGIVIVKTAAVGETQYFVKYPLQESLNVTYFYRFNYRLVVIFNRRAYQYKYGKKLLSDKLQ